MWSRRKRNPAREQFRMQGKKTVCFDSESPAGKR